MLGVSVLTICDLLARSGIVEGEGLLVRRFNELQRESTTHPIDYPLMIWISYLAVDQQLGLEVG